MYSVYVLMSESDTIQLFLYTVNYDINGNTYVTKFNQRKEKEWKGRRRRPKKQV